MEEVLTITKNSTNITAELRNHQMPIKYFVILIHLQGLQSFNQQILLTKVVPMYIHLLMKMKSLLLEVLAGFYQCRTTSRDLYVL